MRQPYHLEHPSAVQRCVAEDCPHVALQRCVRCDRPFCNDHVYPVERDLPTRGLQIPQPYWYCEACLPRVR